MSTEYYLNDEEQPFALCYAGRSGTMLLVHMSKQEYDMLDECKTEVYERCPKSGRYPDPGSEVIWPDYSLDQWYQDMLDYGCDVVFEGDL